jgi:ribonuclease P protein component
MLPKKERLSREAFSRFFAMGRRTHSPSLQCIHTPHPTIHVSVVVSKKIYKLAVKRNKLRRQIYDMVRRYRSEENLSGVYIFIAKDGVKALTTTALHDEVVWCLEKAQKSNH